MGTIYDYVSWRGDLPFERIPINEVDTLIFSLLSYIDFEGLVSAGQDGHSPVSLQAVANAYLARHPDLQKATLGLIVPKDIIKLFKTLKDTVRFRGTGMCAYVNEIDLKKEMQFSAVTFLVGKDVAVVAFRGTDDTIVGWKENFNMSFLPEVPAQVRAKEYLDTIAARFPEKKLYAVGQSKGGNLAVFAGVRCSEETRKRIVGVWSHDGPGFGEGMLKDPRYLDLKPRIHTIVPRSSVVGMLLEHDEDYTVVSSRQVGVMQHNALSWNVMGGRFVHLRTVSEECKHTDRTLNAWIRELTPEQREQFSEALYRILSSDHALTLTELASPKNHWLIHGMQLDPQVGKTMSHTMIALLGETTKERFGGWFGKKKS